MLQGDVDRAISIVEQALASHPNPPYWYYLGLGHALYISGQYKASEEALSKCLELAKKSPYCLRYQIALYGETGRMVDAESSVQAYASMDFETSIGSLMNLMKDKDPDVRSRIEKAFRSAGLSK